MFSWLKRPPDFVIQDNYLLRWHIIPHNRWFNIYLHNIRRSDDDRALHDHPWYNVSIILKGGYWELTPEGKFYRCRWSITFRKATARHRLILSKVTIIGAAIYGVTSYVEDVWTLFITGPKIREWGFWCPKGFIHWKDFVDRSNKGEIGPGCGD